MGKLKQNVHIVLQKKGGIGKSFIARLLLQYFKEKGISIQGIDTDPSNSSLASYKSLNAEKFDIMDGKKIDIRKFDDLLLKIHNSTDDYIIHIGSSNFIGFNEYVTTQNIYHLMQETLDFNVFLHIIVVGNEDKGETLYALKEIVYQDVPDKTVIIWENEHFGRLHDTQKIIESPVIQKIINKIYASVTLEKQNSDLLDQDILLMQKKHYIFDDIKMSDSFNILVKSRLLKYKNSVWEMLDRVFDNETFNREN